VIRLDSGEWLAGQNHFHGFCVGNLTLESDCRTGSCDEAELCLGQPERGMFLGDPNIGLLQHFAAPAKTRAVDRGDQRLSQ
jgi:hypothetical protein